jgi:hypothetical protein
MRGNAKSQGTMDPQIAVTDDRVDGGAGRRANLPWSPVVFALDRLFPKRGQTPYAITESVVVLVIIRAMSFDPVASAFNCFLSYSTIARWSGVSLSTVKRALHAHEDGPAPLICRSKPGHTRGYRHASYRFTLVRHPERFAVARDDARSARREQVTRALRNLQPDRIALQQQRTDFGGTVTEAEYTVKLAALEQAIRRKIPARAFIKRPPPRA